MWQFFNHCDSFLLKLCGNRWLFNGFVICVFKLSAFAAGSFKHSFTCYAFKMIFPHHQINAQDRSTDEKFKAWGKTLEEDNQRILKKLDDQKQGLEDKIDEERKIRTDGLEVHTQYTYSQYFLSLKGGALSENLSSDIVIRVFQNFWGYGSFLRRTFCPDRRETLRIAKKLRFLLWPGLQRWP